MNKEEVWIQIEYLYEEGRIDLVFYSDMHSIVSIKTLVDENNVEIGELFFSKTPLQRRKDALRLAEYLVLDLQDFEIFNYATNTLAEEGFSAFQREVETLPLLGTIDDMGSDMNLVLRKKQLDKLPPAESEIPDEIIALFQPNPLEKTST